MKYLDSDKLVTIKARDFKTHQPFPWANPGGIHMPTARPAPLVPVARSKDPLE